jgi:DEAD/DEAH box helicase domain-containing protein
MNTEKQIGGVRVNLGEVSVTTTVLGFKKRRQLTEEVIGEEPLDLPSQTFSTIALWFDIPQHIIKQLVTRGLDLAGGLHATEHAAIALLPLFALCDRNDIGGLSTPAHADTGSAQIFIYDAYPGGILTAISGCPCEGGCPSCIQSPKCGNNNEPLDKGAAQLILEVLLGR